MPDVHSLRIGVRLGRRLLRPHGRTEWTAAAAVVVSALLVVTALAITLGIIGAVAARHSVLEARTPILSHSMSGPDVDAEAYDIGSQDAFITTLGARDGLDALPPGASTWPEPDEVLLSPAARRAARTNPYLAALVRGRDVGTIGRAGLRDPDEVVAYVGADRSTLAAREAFTPRASVRHR